MIYSCYTYIPSPATGLLDHRHNPLEGVTAIFWSTFITWFLNGCDLLHKNN